MEENIKEKIEMGIVKISDEVVGVIAGLAAAEIKGVVGMNANLVGGSRIVAMSFCEPRS